METNVVKNSNSGLIALGLGGLSWVLLIAAAYLSENLGTALFFVGLVLSIVGAVFGVLNLVKKHSHKVMAVTGLVLALLLWIFVVVSNLV